MYVTLAAWQLGSLIYSTSSRLVQPRRRAGWQAGWNKEGPENGQASLGTFGTRASPASRGGTSLGGMNALASSQWYVPFALSQSQWGPRSLDPPPDSRRNIDHN